VETEDIGVEWRIILKPILNKWNRRVQNECVWLGIEFEAGGFL
jgi:hypothetical protein